MTTHRSVKKKIGEVWFTYSVDGIKIKRARFKLTKDERAGELIEIKYLVNFVENGK